MSPRDFCIECGARIVFRPRGRGVARCEAGHEISESLICTREQFGAVAELRSELSFAQGRSKRAIGSSDYMLPNAEPEGAAEIEEAFERAAAKRTPAEEFVRALQGAQDVSKAPPLVATIGVRLTPGQGGGTVYFSAGQVVAIRPAAAGGSYVTLTAGPTLHFVDDPEVLRGRVDLSLVELARLGRGL